jgi:uncharacterized flavoprotein (TIGR03862 family)
MASNSTTRSVVVIGGGPAGLMAAETVAGAAAPGEVEVVVHDRMPSPARKFLIAGRGGLNLTHSEGLGDDLDAFLSRYDASGASGSIAAAVRAFPPSALVAWAQGLGQDVFTGSSGRIFPKAMKASPLLRAWLRRLDGQGVRLVARHRWLGWTDDGALLFRTDAGGEEIVRADATVLALGGASWPRLGSDAAWVAPLAQRGIAIASLVPSNAGFDVAWSQVMRERFAGQPVKGVALTHGNRRLRGEFMVTQHGVEGGAIYALSAAMREAIATTGEARLYIDLKPDWTERVLVARLAERAMQQRPGESLTNALRKAAGLSPVAIGLMREAAGNVMPATPDGLARLAKGVRIRLVGVRPIDRAISTAGGVKLEEVDDAFMLRRLPGVFVAGEMLDWEAPTGGYLLQASFATGRAAGLGALAWVRRAVA